MTLVNQMAFFNEVTEFRKLITKPKLLTQKDALSKFKEFMLTKHKIEDLDSKEGQAMIRKYKEFPASKALMDYMGV